jgi:peptidylprolyl isomerase
MGLALVFACVWTPADADKVLTMAEVLAASEASDWREIDPADTLYLELEQGRVVIELAPEFAPQSVANILTLVRERYFDGLSIIRSQDNYVVQWGDPEAENEKQARGLGKAKSSVEGEYYRSSRGLPFTPLQGRDAYADEVGFSHGFPVGRESAGKRAWLVHCYGMVGVARDVAPDSGNGSQLYVIIGHAPRHLDRNVTLVGRVVRGIELLSTLPRGSGELGFYEQDEQRVPILSIRLAGELPESQRIRLESLRTDTRAFESFVDARRNRREEWFIDSVGRVGVCNVPLPVRPKPSGKED